MPVLNLIVNSLAYISIFVATIIVLILLISLFNKVKTFIKNKIQQLKIKQYAVTYLINPNISYIDNKNDDDIKVLSFDTYQKSIRTEYFKTRSKHAAIAKLYSNSNYRIRNYGDVLVVGVEEITFVK